MQLIDACAAPGPCTAALTDLLNCARAVVDRGIEIAIRGRMTDTDQHRGSTLIMLFKSSSVKADLDDRQSAKISAQVQVLARRDQAQRGRVRQPCPAAQHRLLRDLSAERRSGSGRAQGPVALTTTPRDLFALMMQPIRRFEHAPRRRRAGHAPLQAQALTRLRTVLVQAIQGIVHARIQRRARRTEMEARARAARQTREIAACARVKYARR